MGRLTGCCCCFDLRDGARAVGITLLVLYSLGLVAEIAGAVQISQQATNGLASGAVVQLVLQFAMNILAIIMNSLLVHGVNKSSRGMMLAWIIFTGIITGLQSIAIAIGFIIACITGVWWLILLVLGFAGLVGVFWYWFVVVLHCYQDMRENNGFVYGNQINEGDKHAL